ncbi:fumarate reductase/succinate dehydrogenase flavoprotein subunit, partial [Brooklawnia sp.]|uniref:fumarate reductase/succinate dehydrogenase flavoprotein subunit n=1 Tax=Brooklawnia sp. TaxID=2699740 RepID=UPI00311F23C2
MTVADKLKGQLGRIGRRTTVDAEPDAPQRPATASPATAAAFVPPASAAPGVRIGHDLDGKLPVGDPETAWAAGFVPPGLPPSPTPPCAHPNPAGAPHRDEYKLVSPLNTKKMTIVVIGTGLAGSGAAAALGELGYDVHAFTYHDAARRAHSVAAQGGINSARAKKVDGDSLHRFVKDTVKGGDFRAREADAFRLGAESVRVIDHMDAIGAPFAREYGGVLATRSFGGVQVSRTYYTRGQTGQQLQVAGAQALQRQVARGTVKLHTRAEMLDLIVDDGVCRGVVVRDLVTGQVWAQPAHAVILATGGYGSVYFHSTLAVNCNASASWRACRHGAYLANPSFVQFHPTALPISSHWQSKSILMSESLRNDGRIWVPTKPGDDRAAAQIGESERDYYLERKYPAFGNLAPRDISSRAAKEQIDSGHGVGPLANSVYLDFSDALKALGRETIAQRYGNLFEMYQRATGEDPYSVGMRIAPGAHFTMGGLWSDFNQMTALPGLFVGGEVGWGYHGANRLGANSLLSACVDGWFTLPFALPDYLNPLLGRPLPTASDACVRDAVARVQQRTAALLRVNGKQAASKFHRRLGEIMYRGCGVERSTASLTQALDEIRELRAEFWDDLSVPGSGVQLNQALERAGRVADFLELAELMCTDALDREESCGAHFRSEYQDGGEARRNDAQWAFVSAWQVDGPPQGEP